MKKVGVGIPGECTGAGETLARIEARSRSHEVAQVEVTALGEPADAYHEPTANLAELPAVQEPVVTAASQARLVSSEPLASGFLSASRYTLEVQELVEVRQVSGVRVDARNPRCAMMPLFVLGADGTPRLVLKGGDTRASRTLRGHDYVSTGMVGGRLDHAGVDLARIGLGEIAEEVGGVPVPESLRRLGHWATATMPNESAERDAYFGCLIAERQGSITGDGTTMEAQSLLQRITLDVRDGLRWMTEGRIGEASRAQVGYARALDAMGYLAELGCYVWELPLELVARYDTLGLGEPVDPRPVAAAARESAAPPQGPPKEPEKSANPMASRINDVRFEPGGTVDPLAGELPGGELFNGRSSHVASVGGAAQVVGSYPNTLLHLNYDYAKCAVYYVDPQRGPMVMMTRAERPALLAGELAEPEADPADRRALTRRDLLETRVDLPAVTVDPATGTVSGEVPPEQLPELSRQLARQAVQAQLEGLGVSGRPAELGCPSLASPGQCDVQYHFYGVEVAPPSDARAFVPLSEAIALCRRDGEGDAHTEALLERLAQRLGWIPTLQLWKDAVPTLSRRERATT